MSDLPRGWEWATLDDLQAAEPRAITDGPFGSNLTSAHYTNGGARVIRLQNIGDGDFVDERAYISLEHYEELKAHDARRGDLVIASLGSNLPRACIVPELGAPAIVKADCIRVRLDDSVNSRWILYALISPESRRHVATRMRGVGRPRLGLGEIRKIPIPVPPLAEQCRIVAALEACSANLAAANAGVAKGAARLSAWRNALANSAIRGGSNSGSAALDESWSYASIGSIAGVGTGATPLRSRRDYYEDGTVPWVTSSAVNRPYVDSADEFITEKALSETSVKLWPPGTLLVAMYGEGKTRGRCSELRISATTNQACAAIVMRPEYEWRRPWVKLVLRARYDEYRKLAAGGVQPNLNLGMIRAMQIPLPPRDQQDRFLQEFEGSSHLAGVVLWSGYPESIAADCVG